MIPKHVSFSLYKYVESIKNLPQNGQIISFFQFYSLKNGEKYDVINSNSIRVVGICIHNLISRHLCLKIFLKQTLSQSRVGTTERSCHARTPSVNRVVIKTTYLILAEDMKQNIYFFKR